MHFYKDISGILHRASVKGNYICTYNIPDEILEDNKGLGIYLDFVNFKEIVYVPEYAIDVELLQFEYLEKVDKIIQDIDFEDLFYNPNFKGLIENVYDKENSDELGNE